MLKPLLRHLRGLPLLLLAMVIFSARPAMASHFLGGELSYRYLDGNGPAGAPFRYEVTALIYINNYAPDMPAPANGFLELAVFNKSQANQRIATVQLLLTTLSPSIEPPTPGNCMLPSPPRPFRLAVYRQTLSLPVSFDGYYAVLAANARNVGIDNIITSGGGPGGNTPMTLYLDMAPPLLPNRSPIFADTAVAVICQGDTTVQLNSAIDPDGDRLTYAFGSPAGGFPGGTFSPPPAPIPYFPNHSVTQPFGPGGFASINATTGLARYRANTQGEYVIAIDVSEYRTINGVEILLGTTRRDLQLVVRPCPANPPPQLPPTTGGGSSLPRNYIIEEGQSLSIPFSATDPNNDPLVLQLNSVLLDGPSATGFNAALNGNQGTVQPGNLTGTAQVTGTGSVAGTFVYNSRCGDGRNTPYSISVTVQDRGCGGQTIADVFTVQVNRAAGPSGITGPTVVCDPATIRTYTASGPASASYNWQITGGTITAGQGTNTIQVSWNSTPTTGTLTLSGVSAFGCASTPVTTSVDIRPLAALSVSPTAPTICRGASSTLTVTGQAGLTYTWTGGSQTLTGSSITVMPQTTTTYTVTGTDGTCSTSQQVTVTVTPPPTADAGPDRTFCSGGSAQLGTPAVAGNSYSWSPTTGLSSATVAQPTVTLTNTTGANITTTYTLTVTTSNGCTSTGTVLVTVTPGATADAGPAAAFCSGLSAQLGTPAMAGTTYSWSPTTGLNNPTTAQPTVTLTNTTGAPITTTYTLTATTANGCTATSTVAVTVNPAAVANPGPAASFCSGGSVQIGSPAVAGTTYSWSPTAGLSDPTAAQPTVTGTNTTSAPVSTTYTLTATTANGCVATATVVVTISPLPVPNPGPAVTICSAGTAQLGAAPVAGNSYSWSPATGLSNPNIANPTVSLPNTTGTPLIQTYTLTVTSANSCVASATVTVTVNPAAVANPGPAASFCSGGSVQIGSPAVAGTTYSWSPTAGLSDPTAAQPTVTGTNTTSAPVSTTYTLTATTANGCVATATVVVTINQAAVADAGTDRAQCVGFTGRIGMMPVAGTTYSWSPTTGLSDPTASNPILSTVNTTSSTQVLTYTLTATTAEGCTATDAMQLTLYPAAVANAGPAVVFCSGGSAQLGVAPIAGTVYSWSPATGLSDPTAANPTVTLTNTTGAPITTTYTLTASITNPGGNVCSSTATVAVTVNQAAVANPGPAVTTCSGVAAQLGVAPVAGTTYAWTPTTGLSDATAANPTVTLTNTTGAPTTTTYTLTATTAQGCTATSTVDVTVNPAAVANAGPAVTFCSGGSAQLGVAPIAGTTYAWSPAAGLSDATAANPTVSLTNTTGAPTTTTYTLTATTANGCVATSTVVVTVNQAAVANPGPAIAFCGAVPTQLGVAPVAGTTYSWSPTGGLNNPNIANPLVTLPNTTGAPLTYTYTLTATTAQGCTASNSVVLTVNPEAVADTGSPQSTCSGGTVQLGVAPIPGTTYSWTQLSGPTANLSDPNISNPTAVLTNTTGSTITYIYSLTATTANGCTFTRGVRIDVFPAAVANPGPSPAITICSGGTAQLGGAPIAGTTYSWSPTTGLSDPTVANPTVTLTNTTNAPITTTYTLTATTANGCVATTTVAVTVNPATIVDAGADRAVCADERTTLGTPTQPGYTYVWTPAAGLSSVSTAQPVLNTAGLNTTMTPLTLKYYLTATTPQGCSVRDSVQVTINPRPASAAIQGSASVCPTVTGVAYSVVNPISTAYQWIVTGGTIASGQGTTAITVDWGAAGTGSVKLFLFNSFGCSSDTTSLPVIINQLLQTPTPNGPGNVLAAAPNNSVCQAGGPYTYATTPYTNGSLYSWTIIGGTQVSTNLNTVSVNWNPVTVPTIGKIVVTETSNPAGGVRCLGTSDTLRVLINPTPLGTLTFTGPARVCQGGSVSFSLPGGFAGSTYVFQLSGNSVPSTGNSVTLASQNTPGTYTLTVQETSAQGCVGPVYTTTYTVDPTPALAIITGSRFVCDITQPLQYSVPNTPGSTYAWTVTGGSITAGQNSSQVTLTLNPGQTSYQVSVRETSPFGCAGPVATITVLPDNPTVTLAVASVDVTSNNRVILTFSAPNSGNTPNQIRVMRRLASAPGSLFTEVGRVAASATSYTDSNLDASANAYEYRLELTNGCGLLLTTSPVQTIRLVAQAFPGTGGRNQGTTQLGWNAYVGFPVQEYLILRRDDNGSATQIGSVPGTTFTFTAPNTGSGFNQCYRIVAVGANNLRSNSNEACVDFTNPVAFYNVITPNNDGKNDVLEIDNIKLYPGNTLTIFNRWGREVYSTSNYQNNWGGADNSAGVYYYLLKMPNGTSTKGWFEIIR